MNNDITKIDLTGCPLIFPKLTAYLILNEVGIDIKGKMGSDFQLIQVILDCLIEKDWTTFPDIAYYDKKSQSWHNITANTEKTIINLGRQGIIKYDLQMFELQDKRKFHVLSDFLRLNSSGNFTTLVVEAADNISV